MHDKQILKDALLENLDETMRLVNEALLGKGLDVLEPTLTRLGRGNKIPHWYEALKNTHSLPNLDGKTVGSVLEMLLVAVMESHTLKAIGVGELKINPARGVDIPDLDLGVKSPSTNFSTSEPFFSAYERLLGNEYDALIMLTDYQEAKLLPPLKIQVQKWQYLKKSQIADLALCAVARDVRTLYVDENEAWLRKIVRFLAYVNQSDWRAKYLLKMISKLNQPELLKPLVEAAKIDYIRQNAIRTTKGQEILAEDDLIALTNILEIQPIQLGVIDAADSWVNETQKEAGRYPNDNEWNRILESPLDGRIGMSFALQWRYNFARIFGESVD